MNIYLKIFLAVLSPFLICSEILASDTAISESRQQQCEEARSGELDLRKARNTNRSHNAYLFNCAISVVVPFPDEKAGSLKGTIEKKQQIADFFISKGIDVTYKDETGSTLLMSVIVSYFPREWKIKTVKLLITKGTDVRTKNMFDKTATDLANFMEDPEIFEIVSGHMN